MKQESTLLKMLDEWLQQKLTFLFLHDDEVDEVECPLEIGHDDEVDEHDD